MLNEIKLRSGATSLFDVQRWMFDVRCSVCSMLDVHLFNSTFIFQNNLALIGLSPNLNNIPGEIEKKFHPG